MLLGIDHLVIAVDDLAEAAGVVGNALGLRVSPGGRHERLGTENRLIWLGDAYVELIAVVDPALARTSWIGAPALRALDAGGGLATYALATDDIRRELERLRDHGAMLDGPLPGDRRRPDGRVVRWSLGLPPSLGPGEPPFLIEHDPGSAEWTAPERAARAAEVHHLGSPIELAGLELPVDDVARTQGRYLRSTALLFRPSLAGGGARDAAVGPHTIRLRRRRAGDRPVIWLRIRGRERVRATQAELLGCRWTIEPGD
jgi:catechol 2,3-dioxygenase-like lactoylglutathione lyase family enzyme